MSKQKVEDSRKVTFLKDLKVSETQSFKKGEVHAMHHTTADKLDKKHEGTVKVEKFNYDKLIEAEQLKLAKFRKNKKAE